MIMKVVYQGEEIELDNEDIPGRDEFDYFNDANNLEDTIEIDINQIKNDGDNNE